MASCTLVLFNFLSSAQEKERCTRSQLCSLYSPVSALIHSTRLCTHTQVVWAQRLSEAFASTEEGIPACGIAQTDDSNEEHRALDLFKTTQSAQEHTVYWTDMHTVLAHVPITSQLILAGLETHISVKDAAMHAISQGYTSVVVVGDACSSLSQEAHVEALEDMQAQGVRVISVQTALQEAEITPHFVPLPHLAAGDCAVWYTFAAADGGTYTSTSNSEVFTKVYDAVDWCPLLDNTQCVAIQGQPRVYKGARFAWWPLYRNTEQCLIHCNKYSDVVLQCATAAVECMQREDVRYNHCVLQLYSTEVLHRENKTDIALDVLPQTPIVIVNFGSSVLTVQFFAKEGAEEAATVSMPPGSALCIGSLTLRRFRRSHTIQASGAEKRNILMTFRAVGTWIRSGDRFICGQGAPKHPLRTTSLTADAQAMAAAFAADEAQADSFDWNMHYGRGFHVTSTMPKHILYWGNGSIPSWRVLLWLAENPQLTVEHIRVLLMGPMRQTRTQEYLSNVNLRGKTPAFVDIDGTIVTESLAILTYLEARYGNAVSLQNGRICAFMHESTILVELYDPIEDWFFQKEGECTIRSAHDMRIRLEQIDRELRIWEVRLDPVPLVPTLADYAFYPALAYLVHRGLRLDPSQYAVLTSYVQQMSSRPTFYAAAPQGWHRTKAPVNVFHAAQRYAASDCATESKT
jgi:glutathione S-transferase